MIDFIDFHAHILPHADHGSYSTDTTAAQLEYARSSGVKRIVATPHYYPHQENPDVFLKRRNACYEHLLERLTFDLPSIRLGAEILICDNIEEMPMLDKLCIEGTRALLLELPFTDFSASYVHSVRSLVNQGYTVLLAHADRYDPENIDKLVKVGAIIQLNADALSGLFIPKIIKEWIKSGKVYALGSDIHGADKKAYARFNKAIKKLGTDAERIKELSDAIWCQSEK